MLYTAVIIPSYTPTLNPGSAPVFLKTEMLLIWPRDMHHKATLLIHLKTVILAGNNSDNLETYRIGYLHFSVFFMDLFF